MSRGCVSEIDVRTVKQFTEEYGHGKTIKEFSAMYRNALTARGSQTVDAMVTAYLKRLEQMYASDQYKQHNVYPSMSVGKICAVIAICLELKSDGMSDPEIISFVDQMLESRRKLFRVLLGGIDLLPGCYQIVKNGILETTQSALPAGALI